MIRKLKKTILKRITPLETKKNLLLKKVEMNQKMKLKMKNLLLKKVEMNQKMKLKS